jgi:hypothetical protein
MNNKKTRKIFLNYEIKTAVDLQTQPSSSDQQEEGGCMC